VANLYERWLLDCVAFYILASCATPPKEIWVHVIASALIIIIIIIIIIVA